MASEETKPKYGKGSGQGSGLRPWAPGTSGNPSGRPKGARSAFVEVFWKDLHAKWKAEGKSILDRVMEDDPSTFLRAVASLMPKEIDLRVDNVNYGVSDQPISPGEWERQFSNEPKPQPLPLVIDHDPKSLQ